MGKLGLVVLVVAACGGGGSKAPDAAVAIDATPPDARFTASTCTSTGGAGGTHKIFLQFEGQIVTKGAAEDATTNVSTIAAGTIAAYQFAAPDRLQQIQDLVDLMTPVLAPYDVELTTTRPATGPYTMIVVGGHPADIGVTAGTRAITPFTCGVIPNAIGFDFEAPVDKYDRATALISALALVNGVDSSNQPGECMCWSGAMCGTPPLTKPCTLGGIGTPDVNACGEGATMDTRLMFEQAFGCRP